MTSQVREVDFIATHIEAEALLTEQRFIKQHRPLYNVRLRDDKSYLYIGISLDEEFPRAYFTRERHRAQARLLRPLQHAKRARATLDLLGKVFQHRPATGRSRARLGQPLPRLLHQARQAPYVGYISKEDYRRNIETIIYFLSGRYRQIEAASKGR